MCLLKVVLFVKGRGSDASTYRPNRDESQWWNRRDALVRCVAALLLGPTPEHRELVLLYDEDFSRMHMTYRQPESTSVSGSLVPTEQAIVALWKRAASQDNGEKVEVNGLTCQLVISQRNTAQVSGMDSKRDVLEYLQKKCSMAFLRQHGLNTSTAVLLRKTNKKALMSVWSAWKQQETSTELHGASPEALELTLKELLQPDSPEVKQVVAGVLHESSENELPCWNKEPQMMLSMQLCLFLGAVRDMTSSENNCLQRLCSRVNIPLVKVRLGPVPEFTSKILTVTAIHHGQGILGPAVNALLSTDCTRKQQREIEALTNAAKPVPVLHFICLVPFVSSQLSTELSDRGRALWCLVRCTVTSLWRSRLVGHGGRNPLRNRMTLVFEDGNVLTLEQDELVKSLAEQHQAAPSEYQVLKALQDKVRAIGSASTIDWKPRALAIVNRLLVDSLPKPQHVLRVTQGDTSNLDLSRAFYTIDQENTGSIETNQCAWVLLSIGPSSSTPLDRMERCILRACRKLKLSVVERPVLASSCQDQGAATITMLQHFCYQNRLFGMLRQDDQQLESALTEKSKKKKRKKQKETAYLA